MMLVLWKYEERKRRGRRAGAEATLMAVADSITAQIPTESLEPPVRPTDNRMQQQTKLNRAIAKRNWS